MEEVSAAQGTKPESEHHQGPDLWKTHTQALLCPVSHGRAGSCPFLWGPTNRFQFCFPPSCSYMEEDMVQFILGLWGKVNTQHMQMKQSTQQVPLQLCILLYDDRQVRVQSPA